ncbi:hypothetical protein TNCT_133121 [Trichonephila clavata]|uniref:Mif2/CENP-C cupin domain-containing protein n=1 Tax=Trichonephila clavata TaxID=2740835 RepID=A0A8X6HAM0_TRICU|nr:hypothetical protein TNCT_133121 [Trichonephila clavata]
MSASPGDFSYFNIRIFPVAIGFSVFDAVSQYICGICIHPVERSVIMKGRKRKCMASNIVRQSGLRKKLRTQEDETHVFNDHIADSNSHHSDSSSESRFHESAFDYIANLFSEIVEEESQPKPETKPTRRIHPIRLGLCRFERTRCNSGSSTMSKEASGQEESPPKPELTPVRSARFQLKRGKPSSAPEESNFKKKRSQEKKSQKKTVKTVKKTPIMDTRKGEIVHKLVHQPFESLQWVVPPNEENQMDTYHIAKTFTSRSNSFGFLDISPFATKESQYSPIYNLHFVVVKGHLQVTIQDTQFTFTVGDTWIVPVGVPYSIKNCTRAKALVSFSTFKE